MLLIRTIVLSLTAGVLATGATGALLTLVALIIEAGVQGLFAGLFLAIFGALYAIVITAWLAAIAGGTLWAMRDFGAWAQSGWTWSFAGALSATAYYLALMRFAGVGFDPAAPLPFAAAGSITALLFRALMRNSESLWPLPEIR